MVELFNLIFVESPIGLSILLLGAIVCFGIMGYQADMKDTFRKDMTKIKSGERTGTNELSLVSRSGVSYESNSGQGERFKGFKGSKN